MIDIVNSALGREQVLEVMQAISSNTQIVKEAIQKGEDIMFCNLKNFI